MDAEAGLACWPGKTLMFWGDCWMRRKEAGGSGRERISLRWASKFHAPWKSGAVCENPEDVCKNATANTIKVRMDFRSIRNFAGGGGGFVIG